MKKTAVLLILLLCVFTAFSSFAYAEESALPQSNEANQSQETAEEPVTDGTQQTLENVSTGAVVDYYKAQMVKVETLTKAQVDTFTEGEIQQICQVKILSGKFKNRIYEITNYTNTNAYDMKIFETGDLVMLSAELKEDSSDIKSLYIYDYYRVESLGLMLICASVILCAVGLSVGLRFIGTILIFALSYHFFFVPFMLKGVSPIILCLPICVLILCINVFTEIGLNKQGLISLLGCMISVIISALIGLYAENMAHLSGISSAETELMSFLPKSIALNLSGLTFALAMLMSMGAAMSVNCCISEEMYEAKQMNKYISRSNLFKYGMQSGRNVLSRNVLTVLFASLVPIVPTWLIYAGCNMPIYELLNLNEIASQLFKVTACIAGISISVPITCALSAYSYRSRSLY